MLVTTTVPAIETTELSAPFTTEIGKVSNFINNTEKHYLR